VTVDKTQDALSSAGDPTTTPVHSVR